MHIRNLMSAVTLAVAMSTAVAVADPAKAGERIDHYEAKSSETLAEAVSNFSEANAQLAEVLDHDELGAGDLETIHELTYTLEEALAMIRAEAADLAVPLEALHLASENHEVATTRDRGAAYLEKARILVP